MISVIEDAVADEVAAMVKKQRDEGISSDYLPLIMRFNRNG